MKKAFDANVSRARPKLRLSALSVTETEVETETMDAHDVEALAHQIARESVVHGPPPSSPEMFERPTDGLRGETREQGLADVLKQRARAAAAPKMSAAEALQEALSL